ncbi:hypothetical protein NQ315_015321 [Exocentrus adspersus]|uniref:RNase H type-1 domain-containing protein n=1 Tax=Exocentrus adspersus TaxID=1586481 RepID=A0AAV8V6L5_9CUCU|nr:hypothetical protein NQ315_015321 [Exocentrus adspersus]
MNPEVKAIMTAAHLRRDATHSNYQSQLGIGLSAVGKALNIALEEEQNVPQDLKEKLLSSLADSGRILSALFNDITRTRRCLTSPVLNKTVKEIADRTEPGEYLFGPDLEGVTPPKSTPDVNDGRADRRNTTACPAVKYGFLYTKCLEREKFLALRRSHMNFNAKMFLPSHLEADICWWQKAAITGVNDIRKDSFHLEIFTDASLTGWGACCGSERTHGFWQVSQKSKHINLLELQAIFYGVKCYARDLSNCNLLIRCDNITAISYINRMGGIQYPELCSLAKEIWQWCEQWVQVGNTLMQIDNRQISY